MKQRAKLSFFCGAFFTLALPAQAEESDAKIRLWFGAGPTLLQSTQAPKRHEGAALSLGGEAILGERRNWLTGVRVFYPIVNENAVGFGAGGIHRIGFAGGFGYSIIPDTLDLVGHLGFAYIVGDSSDFDSKFGFMPGVSLAIHLSESKVGKASHTLELSAFHIEETSGTAVDFFGIGSATCSAIGTMFGDKTQDPSCVRGTAPAVYVFTLLYKLGFQL